MRTLCRRALQSQNLCEQRHKNFQFPEEPAQFSQEKGKSPPHFTCQSDTCWSTQRSHGSSKDVPLAAVQARPHVLPSEGSGLTCHGATAHDRLWGQQHLGHLLRQGCAVNTRSYFTNEETEPVRDPNLLTGQPSDRVYLSFKWWLIPGTSTNLCFLMYKTNKDFGGSHSSSISHQCASPLLGSLPLPASHSSSTQGLNFPGAHIPNFSNWHAKSGSWAFPHFRSHDNTHSSW